MNKHRPTENRVKWTTVALNFFLPMWKDVDDLTIHHSDTPVPAMFPGTENDVNTLYK